MTDRELLNERQCDECGQTTLTRPWQAVNFCANCGVETGSSEIDRADHRSMGIGLSADEVDQLVDDEELSLTRALDDDLQITVHLVRNPP